MKNSRMQIIAQIRMLDRTLQCQKKEVIAHKQYFSESGINRYHLATLMLVVSALFIGWKVERKQWHSKVVHQIVEVGTLAFLNYFKKTLSTLLK